MIQNIPSTFTTFLLNYKQQNKENKITERVIIPPEYRELRKAIKNNNDSTVLYLYDGCNRYKVSFKRPHNQTNSDVNTTTTTTSTSTMTPSPNNISTIENNNNNDLNNNDNDCNENVNRHKRVRFSIESNKIMNELNMKGELEDIRWSAERQSVVQVNNSRTTSNLSNHFNNINDINNYKTTLTSNNEDQNNKEDAITTITNIKPFNNSDQNNPTNNLSN